MLNLPGNSGKFFGDDINFYINDGFMTFTQGEQCLAVRGTDPIKYLDSPYYPAIKGKVIPFVKPKPRFVGDYEFVGLDRDFVKKMLFGEVMDYFDENGIYNYLTDGSFNFDFENEGGAIKIWNENRIKNLRLQTCLYNWILKYELLNIKYFKNRELKYISEQDECLYDKIDAPHDCKCTFEEPKESFKSIFGILWPAARIDLKIGVGLEYYYVDKEHNLKKCSEFRCICDPGEYIGYYIVVTNWSGLYPNGRKNHDDHPKTYGVNIPLFRPQFPISKFAKRLSLFVPKKKIIPGLPWKITSPYNFKLNGAECHIEVLRARGGEIFKTFEKKELTVGCDTTGLLRFTYHRNSIFEDPKKEMELAKDSENEDYVNYVLNHLIDTDLYLYYKLK